MTVNIRFTKLIYSYQKNDLCTVEPKPEDYHVPGYVVIAEQMEEKDAKAFIRRIQKKYVNGRKRGRFPSTEIINLELELFMKLKSYRRKVV